MNPEQKSTTEENRRANSSEINNERETDIGAGKKTGLYGCGFLILGVILVLVVLILTGIYNPFQGTEGVGP